MSVSVAATAHDPSPLPAGFGELYARHHDFVWRCALRLGASPADVEDIVQETFLVALRRYDQTEFRQGEGQGGARPSSWLFAILRNVLRNHARGDRRRRSFLEAFAKTRTDRQPPHSGAQSALGLRLLDEFLHELEPDRRAVFVLAEFEGLRGPEIARALELNANTVRSRLRAARQAFEARFEHERGQLVEAASNDTAPREARARGLVLLGLPVDPWASAHTSVKLGWFATRRGLVSIALSSSVLVGVALVRNIGEPTPHRGVENASDASVETRVRTNHADLSAPNEPNAPETADEVMRAEPAIVVQARSRRSVQVPTLDSNAALYRLTLARRALLDGDAATCLSLVAGDEAWPPALDARRVGLEIGALCKLDQPERARARAAAWVREHPNANVAVDLHAACWNDDNTPASSGH